MLKLSKLLFKKKLLRTSRLPSKITKLQKKPTLRLLKKDKKPLNLENGLKLMRMYLRKLPLNSTKLKPSSLMLKLKKFNKLKYLLRKPDKKKLPKVSGHPRKNRPSKKKRLSITKLRLKKKNAIAKKINSSDEHMKEVRFLMI